MLTDCVIWRAELSSDVSGYFRFLRGGSLGAELISFVLPHPVHLSAFDAELLGVVSSPCAVALMDFCSCCSVWGNNPNEIAQTVSILPICTNDLRVAGVCAGSIPSVCRCIP